MAITDEARIATLEREVAELRALLRHRPPLIAPETSDASVGRRDLLRRVATGAVGAVGATLALEAVTRPAAAAAAPVLKDVVNQTVGSTTQLRFEEADVANGPSDVFSVHDGDDEVLTSAHPAAIGGSATGPYLNGVFGRTTSAGGFGVVGQNDTTDFSGVGVLGQGGAGIGGVGVLGVGSNKGVVGEGFFGVFGLSDQVFGAGVSGLGHGVDSVGVDAAATLTTGGIGVRAAGSRCNAALTPLLAPPLSRSDAHGPGEVVADQNGDLWFCVTTGSPGKWRKVSGSATAGSFHLLAAPARVVDSRNTGGPLVAGSTRVVDLSGQIPVGAGAASLGLTITDTTQAGFLAVASNSVAAGSIVHSNANWFAAGQTLPVSLVSAVDGNRRIIVKAGGPPGASTQFIIDVAGFYL